MNALKVVFLDAATLDRRDLSFDRFQSSWDCAFHKTTRPEETAGRIAGYSVAVTNKVVFDAALLARPESASLRLIAVAATGYNNIDVAAARARGIAVSNVAGYSTESVAQHVFALLLELASHAGGYTDDVRKGDWSKSPIFTMLSRPVVELSGQTLGIIGHGEIGRAVEKRARAFGMTVIVSTRKGTTDRAPTRVPFDEVLRRADVITVHCPLTPDTRGLIGPREFSLMKSTAFLINTARGGVVDETALADALRAGRIAGAGVDVLTREPPPDDHPLIAAMRECNNLVVTPHTAWTSREARARLLHEIAENITSFEKGSARNLVS